MRDEDFYKGYDENDDVEYDRYLKDLAKLKKIREEEKIKKENEKLYKAISENNKKLEEINGDNIRKVEKKSEKINIIGGNRNSGSKKGRNVKSNINEDLDSDNIKIPLPPSFRKKSQVYNETRDYRNETAAKTVKKAKKVPHKVPEKTAKKVNKAIEKKVKANTKEEKTKKPKKTKKKFGFFKRLVLLVMLFSVIFGGTYFAFHYVSKQTGYYTVAVFGVDSRDGNVGEGALSDVNMIVNVNRETGDIQLISVYRDMYSMIDEEGNFHKFNQAYVNGGAGEALNTLNRNLDLNITDYITVNWKAVIDAINILGGVDLEVSEDEFKYINSFISATVESTGIGSYQLEHAGMNHLDGVQAVAYARLRLMDTDFNRTERQRKVVGLAFEKAKKANFSTLYSILMTVLPQTSTNVGIDELIPFAKDISKYHLSETTGFPFEKDTKRIHKRDYVIPLTLRSNVIALHQMLYGKIDGYTYTPSALLNDISNQIIEDSGMGSEGTVADINLDENIATSEEADTGQSDENTEETSVSEEEDTTDTEDDTPSGE